MTIFYNILTDITKMKIRDIKLSIIEIHNQLVHNLTTITTINKHTHLKLATLNNKIIYPNK